MASLESIREDRLKKLNILQQAGIDPYPATVYRDLNISQVLTQFVDLETKGQDLTILGRVMTKRGQGAILFLDLNDGSASIQVLLKADSVEQSLFDLFIDTVDVGDFIQVTGTLLVTKQGTQTLAVTDWKMITKSLRSLPDKWHGLKDEEERLRRRYLDILTNDETREIVIKRSLFWQAMRTFLLERGFLEVDTPIIETAPGGAEAQPFVTHHSALDLEVFLRISPELWLKQLLVAGLPKVFEIGRIFRNEGMDAEHLQDYTQLEWYLAYADYKDGMKLTQEMYRYIAEKTFGTTKFTIKNFTIDLNSDWETYDYVATIKDMVGLDVLSATLPELKAKIDDLNIKYKDSHFNRNRAVDTLWKFCRKKISGPGFLINVPVFIEPLAKRKPDQPEIVERFQVILAGSEMGKGFSELNDPLDQARRLKEQAKLREAGDAEAQMYNADFIEALEYGMPPACGFGVSERLFSFLMNKPIRETQIFPLLKPKK